MMIILISGIQAVNNCKIGIVLERSAEKNKKQTPLGSGSGTFQMYLHLYVDHANRNKIQLILLTLLSFSAQCGLTSLAFALYCILVVLSELPCFPSIETVIL